MVAGLPEELVVPQVANQVGLEEGCNAVHAVLGRVEEVVVARLAQLYTLTVVVGHIAIEAIEVHCLVVGHSERGGEAHTGYEHLGVVAQYIEL